VIHHKRFELLKFEKQTLLVCLLLNLTIFITEITFSFIANSSAMVGDAIDSLGDTITYCIALYAIYKLKGEKEDKTI
jgi:Co/Zn/Cd efflux system component